MIKNESTDREGSSRLVERIVRDALRNASIASTDADALDIAGDALCRLAALARTEVCHV
ncbi:hypothetical protein [Burkholderia anthina]|uniref:Uncharacterized protein n=2 Tax=Burkholderia anthina TaxID=179879 RepID=A0ABS2B272_9BURK|nr:hypothetical protein [Burkholderia anthina]MBM2767074.1 hypothetical protein [Burkholderia anthina]